MFNSMFLFSVWLLSVAICILIAQFSAERVMTLRNASIIAGPKGVFIAFVLFVGCHLETFASPSIGAYIGAFLMSAIFGMVFGSYRRRQMSEQPPSWYQSGSF